MEYTVETLKTAISTCLSHNFALEPAEASDEIYYKAVTVVLREIMRTRRASFRKAVEEKGAKTVYYLSMEFLMGRSLKNSLYSLELEETMRSALKDFGVELDNLYKLEPDPGLGNGGLGRLAACFLDSLSSCSYPAMGYSILYEFGIFTQKIIENAQKELPDLWLNSGGKIWLDPHPSSAVEISFGGKMEEDWSNGYHKVEIISDTKVRAVPYDLFIAGSDGKTVNLLRLWSAENKGLDMAAFNQGDYALALKDQSMEEVISKVLYPEDNHRQGKELRLKQQYFLVSASVQDILKRHLRVYKTLDNLAEKVAIHINDTHPALVIPELMRFFLDECGYTFEKAFEIVRKTTAYTNHTVMKEALECWSEELIAKKLPRIFSIIKEIDKRCREEIYKKSEDCALAENTAIISQGVVKMANLCVNTCHKVNGVSALHSEIIKQSVFKEQSTLYPDKFIGITNGIAHRRWLCLSNPLLTNFLKSLIGDGFVKNAGELSRLLKYKENDEVLKTLENIKYQNKVRLSNFLDSYMNSAPDPNSIYDMQVKRLHEYKRQHLNLFGIISEYLKLKENPNMDFTPKTYIFGAKAAPGYFLAKRIIEAICAMSRLLENDYHVRGKLKVVFVENYSVSLAEIMLPAAEISKQISLAGTEASGTGNMKLMLNGAITLGTDDGANVEIRKAVGNHNIITFGMSATEVDNLKLSGYFPRQYYENNPDLKKVIDFLKNNLESGKFYDLAEHFINTDTYMALPDFSAYKEAQTKAEQIYKDKHLFNQMSLVNIGSAGIFSSDRTVKEYSDKIWNLSKIL